MTSPKEKHQCCDGECNHDDCCGKVEANCPLISSPKEPEEEWSKEFDNRFKYAFSRNNPVVQVKGHHEKEYLHKTYPAVTRFHPSGDVTIHPARYEASRVVSEGAVDEREVYVTEKQWKMDEAIKEFIGEKLSQAKSQGAREALAICCDECKSKVKI